MKGGFWIHGTTSELLYPLLISLDNHLFFLSRGLIKIFLGPWQCDNFIFLNSRYYFKSNCKMQLHFLLFNIWMDLVSPGCYGFGPGELFHLYQYTPDSDSPITIPESSWSKESWIDWEARNRKTWNLEYTYLFKYLPWYIPLFSGIQFSIYRALQCFNQNFGLYSIWNHQILGYPHIWMGNDNLPCSRIAEISK